MKPGQNGLFPSQLTALEATSNDIAIQGTKTKTQCHVLMLNKEFSPIEKDVYKEALGVALSNIALS